MTCVLWPKRQALIAFYNETCSICKLITTVLLASACVMCTRNICVRACPFAFLHVCHILNYVIFPILMPFLQNCKLADGNVLFIKCVTWIFTVSTKPCYVQVNAFCCRMTSNNRYTSSAVDGHRRRKSYTWWEGKH